MRQQVVARLVAEARDVERWTRRVRTHRADCMHAADEAAHPFQRGAILQLRCAAAALRIHGEAEAAMRMQGSSTSKRQGGYGGDLARDKLRDQRVFFLDLGVGPAPGTIELGNQRWAVLHPHLVDAV